MESIVDALFQYAQERRLSPCLTGEYWALIDRCDRDHDALEDQLSGAAAEAFARYLDHRTEADWLEARALFRCGLSMGLELGRLGQGT